MKFAARGGGMGSYMEKIKNFVKQNLQIVLFVLCGILVVSGILVMIFGGGESEGAMKVLFIIFGIVLIVLGCALLFFAMIVGSDETANFFLYDSKTKSNISVDEVDFALVNKRMTFIMTKLSSTASQVWTENVFENNEDILGEDDSFAPLVAYKILYDLSDRANESIWNLYVMADPAIIDAIVAGLAKNDDNELGNAFKFLHSNANGNYDRTEKFLNDNKKYIQNKMVKYVKTNIEKF